jgi:DNA-binding PadR family transcriptional regulator
VLTELEGAILSEIHHRGNDTAFHVRRAFAASPSLEWKGSAGAVYPAVKRLEKNGYLEASAAQGARRARRLTLTARGHDALMAWACDPAAAASVGIDPFRLRSGIWAGLDPDERAKVFAALRVQIAAGLSTLEASLPGADPVERVRIELGIEVQQARLRTVERWARERRQR